MQKGVRSSLLFILAAAALLAHSSVLADGIVSLGNTDGVLTWNLGTLEPGDCDLPSAEASHLIWSVLPTEKEQR